MRSGDGVWLTLIAWAQGSLDGGNRARCVPGALRGQQAMHCDAIEPIDMPTPAQPSRAQRR